MKPKAIVAITAILTVAGLIVLSQIGMPGITFNVGGGSKTAPTAPTDTTPAVAGVTNKYTGAVNFQVKGAITANGTAPTAGTDYTVQYLQKIGDSYTPLGSDTDGTETIVIGANDIVYARVVIASGKSYYIDPDSTVKQQADGTVKPYFYADPLGSGLKSYVFPLDMSLIKSKADPGFTPTYEWYPRFYGESAISLSKESSQLNLGNNQFTKTINWELTLATQPGASAIKAIQIRVNGTDATNEVAEEQSYIDIPNAAVTGGSQRIYLSDMTQSVDYTTTAFNASQNDEDRVVGKTIFRHVYSQSTVNGANIISVPTTGSNIVKVPVTITGTIGNTNGGICVELRVEPINARNVAGTAVTDSVELVAPASNTYECLMPS